MVAHFAAHGAQDAGTNDRIDEAMTVLRSNFGIDTRRVRFLPALPQSATGQQHANSLPTYAGVFGLDRETAWHLAQTGWISTPRVTFRVELAGNVPPSYLGAFTDIRRFGSTDPEEIEARIQDTIENDSDLHAMIFDAIVRDADNGGRWRHHEPDLVFEHIMDSIRVDILPYQSRGGAPEPLARLYIESPTWNAADWNTFRARIMALQFGDDLIRKNRPGPYDF